MDPLALQILEQGWHKDQEILKSAIETLHARLQEQGAGRLAAAGYELNRIYNIFEKAFERICDTFENHFDKTGAYHDKLIERANLPLPGIRPAFLPDEAIGDIRELKGFRHIFRHAYDLELDPKRLLDNAARAAKCVDAFPLWCEKFLADARAIHAAPC